MIIEHRAHRECAKECVNYGSGSQPASLKSLFFFHQNQGLSLVYKQIVPMGAAKFFYTFVKVDQIKKCRRTKLKLKYTVEPLYNYHPWDPKVVSIVERWSLFRGKLCNKSFT